MRAPILTLKRARNLRRRMTLPEVILWQELRGSKLQGLQFRRQHPIGPYILDFYCAALKFAVEIDGSAHDNEEQYRHDQRRSRWLATKGIKVVRIAAADILRDENLEDALRYIEQAAAPSTTLRVVPLPRKRGRNH